MLMKLLCSSKERTTDIFDLPQPRARASVGKQELSEARVKLKPQDALHVQKIGTSCHANHPHINSHE